EAILERFGRFRFGFDFGPPLPKGHEAYLWRLTVEPRFTSVGPATTYDETRGYGFVESAAREVVAPPATTDRRITRATGGTSAELRSGALFVDALRGRGPQTFRIRTGPGAFTVSVLK